MLYPKANNSEVEQRSFSDNANSLFGMSVLWHIRRLLKHGTQLREISKTATKSWEAVSVFLAADFRQTLPVIQRGSAADEINACFKIPKL